MCNKLLILLIIAFKEIYCNSLDKRNAASASDLSAFDISFRLIKIRKLGVVNIFNTILDQVY